MRRSPHSIAIEAPRPSLMCRSMKCAAALNTSVEFAMASPDRGRPAESTPVGRMYTTRRQEDSPQMRVGAIALDDVRATVEAREPFIRALLPEDDRFDRLSREAEALVHRYPDPSARP